MIGVASRHGVTFAVTGIAAGSQVGEGVAGRTFTAAFRVEQYAVSQTTANPACRCPVLLPMCRTITSQEELQGTKTT